MLLMRFQLLGVLVMNRKMKWSSQSHSADKLTSHFKSSSVTLLLATQVSQYQQHVLSFELPANSLSSLA
jgi:hypothetical protein